MGRLVGLFYAIRGHYDAMDPKTQSAARRHLSIDLVILIFLGLMVWVGLTRDPNAFYIWVPLLCVFAWVRFRQARQRWSL